LALDIEQWIIQASLASQGFIVGRMSPLTVLLFVLLSFATLVSFPIHGVGRMRNLTAQSTAAVVLILALILVVGYWYDAPLLYGGKVTPVAVTTAIGFILLSVGLVFDGTNALFSRWVTSPFIFARFMRWVLPGTKELSLTEGYNYDIFSL